MRDELKIAFRLWISRALMGDPGAEKDVSGEFIHSRMDRLVLPSGRLLWIKRDDELGGPWGGSKARKLASLIPALQHRRVTDALLVGSHASNFVVAAASRLKVAGFDVHAWLRGPVTVRPGGQPPLIDWMLDPVRIHWVDRAQWPEVLSLAEAHGTAIQSLGRRPIVIPEGGAMAEALPGACTLGVELVDDLADFSKPEKPVIFLDAGTGFTAQAVLLAWGILGCVEARFEIVLMAGSPEGFQSQLQHCLQSLATQIGLDESALISRLPPFRLHQPPTARSFGSVNQAVRRTVADAARQTGILWDPIYGAKMWMVFREREKELQAHEIPVLVHSGGPGIFSRLI